MADREHRRARWEGALQTAVFIGAMLVLVAVLYTSLVVQRGRREEAQQTEVAKAEATAARKSEPAVVTVVRSPTVSAYPPPRQLPSSQARTSAWFLPAGEVLDPAYGGSSFVLSELFLGLTRWTGATAQAQPWLAESWDVSADGLVYTFHLRQGVAWVRCDAASRQVYPARQVTADDVAFAIERVLRLETQSPRAEILYPIRGAQARHQGDERAALGLEVVDTVTLRFTLTYAATDFPTRLSDPVAWPVPRELVESAGDAWAQPGTILVNGTYCPVAWQSGGTVTVVLNPWLPAGLSLPLPPDAYPSPLGADNVQ